MSKPRLNTPESLVCVGDTLICSGIAEMVIPAGGSFARSTEIRIRAKFRDTPSVTGTIVDVTGPGSVFAIYGIKVNDLGNETQVAIEAQNVQIGIPVPLGKFVCHYVVIGKGKLA